MIILERTLCKTKYFVLPVFIIFFFIQPLFSQADSAKIDSTAKIASHLNHDNVELDSLGNLRLLDNFSYLPAFSPGEKLTFEIRYGFVPAGNATMEVKELTEINGRKAFRILTTARSKKTFDLFYKVRDSVETIVDAKGLFSWKFHKRLREGGYKFDLSVDYNQQEGLATIEMIRYHDEEPLRIRNKENFDLKIPLGVLDILSSFYYVRTQNLRVGRPIFITNHDNKKIYDLKVIIQRREKIKVEAGTFNSIMVQPVLEGDSIFKQKGKLWVWLSDDKYKIPLKMESAVFIGKITTELIDIEGLSLPLPSQIK